MLIVYGDRYDPSVTEDGRPACMAVRSSKAETVPCLLRVRTRAIGGIQPTSWEPGPPDMVLNSWATAYHDDSFSTLVSSLAGR